MTHDPMFSLATCGKGTALQCSCGTRYGRVSLKLPNEGGREAAMLVHKRHRDAEKKAGK